MIVRVCLRARVRVCVCVCVCACACAFECVVHVAHTQREICESVSMHVCLHCEWCVNMYICMVYLLQADMVETETCNNGSKTAECV